MNASGVQPGSRPGGRTARNREAVRDATLAELSRRWLNGADIDLARAAKLLPDRIWASLQA